jgi:hypothetical protein
MNLKQLRVVVSKQISFAILAVFVVPAAHAQLIFTTDWSMETGNVPIRWQAFHAVNRDRLLPMVDRSSPKAGIVLRVEVRAGDKVGGWSGERSEVSGMRNMNGMPIAVSPTSGHEYYGLSVKLDRNWQAPERNEHGSVWGTFFQLHGPNELGASPSVALMVDKDFHLDLCGGDVLDGGKRAKPRGPVSYAFSNGSLSLGQWTQFLLDVVWAADDTGSITVLRRSDRKANWEKIFEKEGTATLQYRTGEAVGDHYWKAGLYRSESKHTNLLWLGPIVRGTNRNLVATAAVGKR